MIRLVAGAVLAFGLSSVAPASPIAASAPAKASTQETNLTDPKSVLAALGASVFVKKDFSQLDQLIRDDYIQHNPLVSQGSKGFREFFEAWLKAVPDFKYELKKIVSEGDLV